MQRKWSHILFSTALASLTSLSGAEPDSTTAFERVQERLASVSDKLNGMEESYLETKGAVEKLSKIKVSGYVQTQMRIALQGDLAQQDTLGEDVHAYNYSVGDYSGGKFGNGMTSLFQVRRGRFKIAYENKFGQAVVQLDCVPKGVTIKDAYVVASEPWLKTFALKAGVFDRPFGFEIMYSSSSRESPERARIFQTLFPGERDLGVMLDVKPAENLPVALTFFNARIGAFTGNGINDETDNKRDIIGRLGFAIPLNTINLAIDGGVSGYDGTVTSLNDTLYQLSGNRFAASTGNRYDELMRRYYGADLQLYYDLPVIGGFSLRGEYLQGYQPGSAKASDSPKSSTAATTPYYLRQFQGFYITWIQNINPLHSQLVFKFDRFDPNTLVSGEDVNAASGLKNSELAYNTLGLGLVYHFNENVKFVLYWDHVTNEQAAADLAHNSSMRWYTQDLNDDVLTMRVQYKF